MFAIAMCALVVSCIVSSRPALAQVPAADHVFLVVLENHKYESVIGNASMPFLNSLASHYGLASVYYANAHYSLPNYFWLTTGSDVTLNESPTTVYDVNNMVRYLLTAGKTWKAYEESLPYTGYLGPSVPPYVKDHNPFAYLSDVAHSSEKMNLVPFTKFASDCWNNTLPHFSLIVPNNNHNGHNGQLATADSWLKTNLSGLLASPMFQPGGHGILIITFDESLDTDCRPLSYCPRLPENQGGGRVATIIVSPMAKGGYRSTTKYQHQNLLRTVLEALGIYGAPNAAATAKPMSDFFQ